MMIKILSTFEDSSKWGDYNPYCGQFRYAHNIYYVKLWIDIWLKYIIRLLV